jgi:hypothetical protein
VAVFTGTVDPTIKTIWNRINLALILHCLPSQISNEDHKDIQALKIVLSAQQEMKEKNKEV